MLPLRRRALELRPDLLESEKALLAGQPLRSPDGPFGESQAGLGVMAEVNGVGRGVEHQFVHSDDFALAKGGNLKLRAGGLTDDSRQS